jgi:hypothetical protein
MLYQDSTLAHAVVSVKQLLMAHRLWSLVLVLLDFFLFHIINNFSGRDVLPLTGRLATNAAV